MTDAADPRPARYANGRFGPGNPGRRLGARGRSSNEMVLNMLAALQAELDAAAALKKALAVARRRPRTRIYGETPVSTVINGGSPADAICEPRPSPDSGILR